ncbi:MAG: XRE family transcriptional regulator [Methylococcaceae bacterium]|nr:MAG: XRE family transcriptional regulator [Methylococcaceae bacterium]
MQVHEKLKVIRQCKGWSQEEMAENLGYSANGYAKIERGETDIKVDKLEKIAEAIGVDLQQLLGLNEKNIFNVIENFTQSSQSGNIYLTETQCAHELEKALLLLQERDKEIENLKQQLMQLQEINSLLKR